MVNWATTKNGRPTSTKGAKSKTERYVARIVYFADDRLDRTMKQLRDNLLEEDETDVNPEKIAKTFNNNGKRPLKRPSRYLDLDDDDDDDNDRPSTPVITTKKKKIVTKTDLVERLKKKQEDLAKKVSVEQLKVQENENLKLKEEVIILKAEKERLQAALSLTKELPELLKTVRYLNRNLSISNTVKDEDKLRYVCNGQSPSGQSSGSLQKVACRKLQEMMTNMFPRVMMATHTLTGGSSNANKNMGDPKPQLDKFKMDQIFAKVRADYPQVEFKYLKEAARNKLSNERKLHNRSKTFAVHLIRLLKLIKTQLTVHCRNAQFR